MGRECRDPDIWRNNEYLTYSDNVYEQYCGTHIEEYAKIVYHELHLYREWKYTCVAANF